MRQRVVRGVLVGGVIVLALILLLATCGAKRDTKGAEGPRKPVVSSPVRVTQLTVPSTFDTTRGWDIAPASPDYAVAGAAGRIAYLERVNGLQFRLRTLDPGTGEHDWDGPPWRSLFSPDRFPRLLSVTQAEREFFVTWSYGRLETDALTPSDFIVSLDVYDAADGSRRRVEVPWPDAPIVTATGPSILISDGKAASAVVDPATGDVVQVAPASLGYPKGCAQCRKLTEVRGTTGQGLLVSGAREFWVRGGWFSRKVAPKDTDPASGVPASMAHGYLLAKWQKKKGAKDAGTHEIWALHDTATGAAVAQAQCRKPAIAPGDDPRLIASPVGHYLVAGRLAFDLVAKTAYCFEEPDGTKPLTLTTVTDDGTAYGATDARSPADALAGGGTPVTVDLTTGTPAILPSNIRLPGGETTAAGLFRWTDEKDIPHLTGYPHRD
ncbi:hypothetical protein [Streptomyces sp. NPDC051569]|uniref:hypothetical protein n=1 Tax=Streptomyces sp. NPDC051569 TaxID=3365661 RepID=UPI0037A2E1BF